MKKSHWIIQDWAGNHCYTDKTFKSFEDARAFISELADEQANTALGYDETIYNGICEDLYATEVKEA